MSSTEAVRKMKFESGLDRDVELRRSATQAMERARAMLRTELNVSEAFIGSVADDSGNVRPTVVDTSQRR